MRIVLERNTYVRGVSVAAGETVDVAEVDARALIAMGKARLAPGESSPAEPEEKPEQLPEKIPDLKSLPYPLRVKVGRRSKKNA